MSTAVTEPVAPSTRSPFALLREADEAEEVLILTYAANLDFFERFALGQARSLQAATSVISDAAMVVADPATVGRAGLRYVEARAVCPGRSAFHPELLVIASRERATVAIGSGNLTLAGWHGNEELWSIVRAARDRGVTTIREVASFLRSLAEGPIQLSAEAPPALTQVAELLESMSTDEPGPRLVSTLGGPIIDELPTGPVEELIVYAPFYDARLRALQALKDRLVPDQMTVFVQPQTSVDGAALGAWIEKHGVELRWCSDERYRHGKLVEWQIAGQREALTGSPNLSTGALLRGIGPQSDPGVSGSARGSANLELGTITPIPNSLAPAVAEPPRGGLSGVEFRSDPADADGPKVLLLGATAMGDSTVELRLASELLEKARVQVHDPIRDWTSVPIDELLPGKSSYRIASTELGAGRALRLLGPEDASNEVFISDPLRARRRPFRRIGPDVSEPPDLVEEGGLTALFEIAELMRPVLLRLGVLTPRSKSPTGDVPSDTPVGEEPSDDAEDERLVPAAGQTLSDYLAACAAVLNETSVEWALALPTLPGLPDDSLEARGGLLTDETDDSAADAGKKAAQQGSRTLSKTVRNLSEKRRAQLRRFCEKALTLVSKWPNLMRAYTARLTLTGIAAELWSTEDERREVLVALVDGLTSSGDEPTDEERRALAAYAAVALAFLRMDIDRLSVSTEPTLKFRAASEKVRPILASFDPTRLETVLQELEHDSQPSLTAIEVEELAEQTRNPLNAIDRAIDLLRTEDEIEAHSEDGVLVLDDPLPRGFQRELLRITGVVGGPRAAVFGTTLAGIDVMCAWDKPRLVIAQRSKIGFGGHLYELQHSTPAGIAASWDHGRGMSDNLPRRVVDWTPGRPPPEAVAEILRATGLESNDSE